MVNKPLRRSALLNAGEIPFRKCLEWDSFQATWARRRSVFAGRAGSGFDKTKIAFALHDHRMIDLVLIARASERTTTGSIPWLIRGTERTAPQSSVPITTLVLRYALSLKRRPRGSMVSKHRRDGHAFVGSACDVMQSFGSSEFVTRISLKIERSLKIAG